MSPNSLLCYCKENRGCTKINNVMLLTHSISHLFMSFQSDIKIPLMEQRTYFAIIVTATG